MSLTPEEARMLGGSDMAGILGLSPWATPLTVYARIISGEVQSEQTPAMRRGTLMEPVVRDMYAQDSGAELLGPMSLRHARHPFLRASLDDVARRAGARKVLEIKTDGRGDGGWGEPGTDAIPEHYLPQVHLYLGMGLECGAVDSPEADVAVLLLGVDDSPRVYHVRHDADVYGWLLESAARFWKDHVVPRRPPSPTNPAREAEAVRRLFRREREPLVDFAALPPEERAMLVRYAEARRSAKVANEEVEVLELRVKLALGWRVGVQGLPQDTGLRSMTWKADETGRVAWKGAFEALAKQTGLPRAEVEALLEKHRGEPARALRVTEVKGETT